MNLIKKRVDWYLQWFKKWNKIAKIILKSIDEVMREVLVLFCSNAKLSSKTIKTKKKNVTESTVSLQ